MKLQILGSGGAYGTPRPLCGCPLCCKARDCGGPFVRGGPSVFVHDLQLLIDTPEDIAVLLNRCKIDNIRYGLYSHGHPDHVLGRRVWEANLSTRANDSSRSTEIIIPEDQLEGLKLVGTLEHLRYLEHRGAIKIRILKDVKVVTIEGYSIEFVPLAEPHTYGFLITNAGTRALVIMDELHGWTPPRSLLNVDLAILPMGVLEFEPFSDNRLLKADTPLLRTEATLEQTASIIRDIKPRQTVLIHIEEPDNVTEQRAEQIATGFGNENLSVQVSFDSLAIFV